MKQIRLPAGYRKACEQAGVAIVRVTLPSEARRVGIHLLQPTKAELWDALNRAERDLFPAILIHGFSTWGYQHGYNRKPKPKLACVVSNDWALPNPDKSPCLTLIAGGAA